MGHHKLSYSQHGQANGRAGLGAALQAACGLGLLLVLLIMGGCGRHGVTGAVPDGDGPDPGAAANAETELSLDSPAPAGVDAALWRELTTALRGALAGRDKRASGLPAGDAARVTDFVIVADALGAAQASWSFNLAGDYNHNGSVGVDDLALAANYWESAAGSYKWPWARFADGNGDGCVDLGDITPLGQHFGEAVSGFEVQEADTAAEGTAWTAVQQVGYGVNTQRVQDSAVQFRISVPTAKIDHFYRVVPYYTPPVGAADFGLPGNAMRYYGGNAGAGAWPMQGCDPRKSYRGTAPGPARLGLAWIYANEVISSHLFSDPILGLDGSVYAMVNSKLLAVDPGGDLRWQLGTDTRGYTSPVLGADGTLYCTSYDNDSGPARLIALSSGGVYLWSVELGEERRSVLLADDRLYLRSSSKLECFSVKGERLWNHGFGESSNRPHYKPVKTAGGLIALVDGYDLYAFTASGVFLWRKQVGNIKDVGLVALNSGGIAVPLPAGMCAYSSTGEIMYEASGFSCASNIACASDDSLHFVSVTNESPYIYSLQAVDRDGQLLYSHPLPDKIKYACLALDSNDQLYVNYLTDELHIACCGTDGIPQWEQAFAYPYRSGFGSLSLGAEGTLYLSCGLGLIAFDDDGFGVPGPPVPSASSGDYYDHVRLSWPAVEHADSYRIYRDGAALPVAEVTGTQFDDYGVLDGSFRTYTISGVNFIGEGPPSAPVQGRICIPPSRETAPGDWAMQGHDARHTYRSSIVGPEAVELKWSIARTDGKPLYYSLYDCPAFGSAGTAYMNSAGGLLRAFDADGHEAWRIKLGSHASMPAVGADGTVYCTAHQERIVGTKTVYDFSRVYAVNPNRTVKWIYEVEPGVLCAYRDASPTLDADGNIHCLLANGELVAISPAGEMLQYSQLPPDARNWLFTAAPAVDATGNSYLCLQRSSFESHMMAFDPGGTLLWHVSGYMGSADWSSGPPLVMTDGQIYTPGTGICIYSQDGSHSIVGPAGMFSNLALAPDGRIFCAGISPDALYWLDVSHGVHTLASVDSLSQSCLMLDAAGKLYSSTLGDEETAATVSCYAADGTLLWSQPVAAAGYVTGLALRDDGALFVTTDTAVLVYGEP